MLESEALDGRWQHGGSIVGCHVADKAMMRSIDDFLCFVIAF